jgi:hypothetical protein
MAIPIKNLFDKPINTFRWQDVKTWLLRSQYNETLKLVVREYFGTQYTNPELLPNFLNSELCLTIKDCRNCSDIVGIVRTPEVQAPVDNTGTSSLLAQFLKADNDYQNAKSDFDIAERNAKFLVSDEHTNKSKEASTHLKKMEGLRQLAEHKYQNSLKTFELAYENAKTHLDSAKRNFAFDSSITNEIKLREAEGDYRAKKATAEAASKSVIFDTPPDNCYDPDEEEYNCMPLFFYTRKLSIPENTTVIDQIPAKAFLKFETDGLSVGALIWLYYYERMGIFKILGALMDDYNYRGKYTISGSRVENKKDNANNTIAIRYSLLMDRICTLYRTGMSSNQRDRICTYQRVLGVTIDNNLGIESEKNAGFMQTFSKLMDYMLEYYKAKQLSQAIQSQTGTVQPRSSVATQTSIRDTMNLLKQQFEPMEYGRNQINTFLGISTVHATLCLLSMLRKEIGIPDQYEKPEEFIPAAYDILVAKKRPLVLNETNRFIVYDNCASYGYRLLTDIETANINALSTIAVGSTLDIWLNDVEGLVEGYRNAYASVPEGVEAIV